MPENLSLHRLWARKAGSLRSNDSEKNSRQECRHGQSRSTSTRIQSWRRLKREDLCVQDSQRFTMTIGLSSSRQLEAAETSSSRRPVATEDSSNTDGRKVHLKSNTDGANYLRKFDDPAKNLSRRVRRSTNFTITYWTVFVQHLVHIPPISKISRSTLRSRANSRATDCLWASSWPTNDHEDFKRMMMEESFPRTHDLIQPVQRQVKIMIGRNDAENMQILQEWNILRCSTIAW